MKTLSAALLALGLLSSAAAAQYCPPGYGYGSYRPTHGRMVVPVEKPTPPPAVAPETPADPEPAPTPAEPAPQK